MALVQNLGIVGHGRRTGTPKSENVFVLPQEELDRIHHSLTRAEREDIERQERAAAIKVKNRKRSHIKTRRFLQNQIVKYFRLRMKKVKTQFRSGIIRSKASEKQNWPPKPKD